MMESRAHSHAAVKVHPVNSNRRIILDSQIDMFADAEPKIARLREVLLAQFILLHFEAALENFFGFGATDGHMHGDFVIAADAKGTDCVAGFACRLQ